MEESLKLSDHICQPIGAIKLPLEAPGADHHPSGSGVLWRVMARREEILLRTSARETGALWGGEDPLLFVVTRHLGDFLGLQEAKLLWIAAIGAEFIPLQIQNQPGNTGTRIFDSYKRLGQPSPVRGPRRWRACSPGRDEPACQDRTFTPWGFRGQALPQEGSRILRPRSVILTIGCEYVEHLGLLECGCLMLHATRHKERIAGFRLELAAGMLEDQMPADHVHHLLVRMTVTGSDPAFPHAMTNEHHAWAVRHYLPTQSIFRIRHVGIVRTENVDVVLVHELL
jgi:hypothetical protein